MIILLRARVKPMTSASLYSLGVNTVLVLLNTRPSLRESNVLSSQPIIISYKIHFKYCTNHQHLASLKIYFNF